MGYVCQSLLGRPRWAQRLGQWLWPIERPIVSNRDRRSQSLTTPDSFSHSYASPQRSLASWEASSTQRHRLPRTPSVALQTSHPRPVIACQILSTNSPRPRPHGSAASRKHSRGTAERGLKAMQGTAVAEEAAVVKVARVALLPRLPSAPASTVP